MESKGLRSKLVKIHFPSLNFICCHYNIRARGGGGSWGGGALSPFDWQPVHHVPRQRPPAARPAPRPTGPIPPRPLPLLIISWLRSAPNRPVRKRMVMGPRKAPMPKQMRNDTRTLCSPERGGEGSLNGGGDHGGRRYEGAGVRFLSSTRRHDAACSQPPSVADPGCELSTVGSLGVRPGNAGAAGPYPTGLHYPGARRQGLP